MPLCAPCAKGRRSRSIFAGMTRGELDVIRGMARPQTQPAETTEGDQQP